MTVTVRSDKQVWSARALVLVLVAVLACLSVMLINGEPLYYFDTGSYIRQGSVALDSLFPPVVEGGGQGGAATADKDDTATGSRSLIYGLVMASFLRANALSLVPILHLCVVFLMAWLLAKTAIRSLGGFQNIVTLTTVPLLVAATTSLPFYIAYMMPDIFAPVMLMAIAALTAFGPKMRIWELLLISGLALLCSVLHPSHMAIAGLMIPFVILAALVRKMPGRWRATVLMVAVLALSVAERKAFQITVETTTNKEVVYTPHITARLIVDGPGMDYLDDVCPDAEIPTCALHEALSWSDDPYRLTASHIIFERSPRLGSFRRLPKEDQKQIALTQRDFAKDVFLSHPFATTWALINNGYRQVLRDSIDMTIPSDIELNNAHRLAGITETQQELIRGGLLSVDRSWIEPIDVLHSSIYLISFVYIVIMLLIPGRVSPDVKFFALFILIGIAVNAIVCGGVSQPADRYGARVMWLLPFSAAFLYLARTAGTPRISAGEAS